MSSSLVIIFISFLYTASSAPANEYKITYIIDVKDDGNAIWNVEYRTLLVSKEDFDSFENYTQQLQSVYLNESKELMQKSVSEAAAATSRNMAAKDFTGYAVVRSSPTGKDTSCYYSYHCCSSIFYLHVQNSR